MGPQNAVVGESFATDLPQTEVSNQDLAIEKNMARFSRSKEFQVLKDHLEQRIKFFENHFPNGDPIAAEKDLPKLAQNWVVANLVIGEFKAVLDAYERANEAFKDAAKRTNN